MLISEVFNLTDLAQDKALRLGGDGGEAQEGPLALAGDVALLSQGGRCEGSQNEEESQDRGRHLYRQLNFE